MKIKQYSGITLIELMIVVAIVGILASIAYPSYQGYMESARRQESRNFVFFDITAAQNTYKKENRAYTDNFQDLGYGNANSSTFDDDFYRYTLSHPGNNDAKYQVTALPINNHKDKTCGSLVFEMPGYKMNVTKPGANASNCWKVEL